MIIELTRSVFFLVTSLLSFALAKEKKCGTSYLTVMAENDTFAINWSFKKCPYAPDTIILYEKSPKVKHLKILVKIKVRGRKSGFVPTSFTFNFNNDLPGNWNINDTKSKTNAICFPYYIKSFRKNKTIDSDCLRIQPDWMKNFGHLRIGQMFIPGTYRSGALKKSHFPTTDDHQSVDVWIQMVFGIRYFDFHMEYNETAKRNPNSITVPQQFKIIEQFLRRSKREVVILDFSGFVNFVDITHYKVINLLKEIFADLILSRNLSRHKLGPKLYDCWKFDKRIMINYRNSKVVKKNPWLWNDILLKNGFADDLRELKEYFKTSAKKHEHKEMVCVLQVTLKNNHNLDEKKTSLINNKLNDWIIDNDLLEHVNIIAVEFFLSSRIIDNSIEANEKKYRGIY